MAKKSPPLKSVETIKHGADKRKNIPTAEHQSVLKQEDAGLRTVKYPRNTDLDPQLVWRGKDDFPLSPETSSLCSGWNQFKTKHLRLIP